MDTSVFPKELIEEIKLDNGLVLRLFDRSRRVAGDRWYIGLLAEIEIPVKEDYLKDLHPKREDLKSFLEETKGIVVFQMKKERNFIDEREREEVLKGLLNTLKASCVSYMGHGAFGSGCVRKCFKEHCERKNWWK